MCAGKLASLEISSNTAFGCTASTALAVTINCQAMTRVFPLKSEVLIDLCVMSHFNAFTGFLLVLCLSFLTLQTNPGLDFVLVTGTGISVINNINN